MNIELPIRSDPIRPFQAETLSATDAERACLLARNFREGTLSGGSYALSFLPILHTKLLEQPEIFVISGQINGGQWQLELPLNACLDLMQDIEPLLMPTGPATIAEAARCFIRELAIGNLPTGLQSGFMVSAATKAVLPGASRWPFRVRLGERSLVAVLALGEKPDFLMTQYVDGLDKDDSDIRSKIPSDARIRIATYRTTSSVVEGIGVGDVILVENFRWNDCSILVKGYIQLDCRIDGTDIAVESITVLDADSGQQVETLESMDSFISFEEADHIMQDDPRDAAGSEAMPGRILNPTGTRDHLPEDEEHDLPGGIDLDRVQVEIVFDAGRVSLPLVALETIAPGYVFQLEKTEVGQVSMLVSGKHIGKAELVEVDGRAGFRILEIIK
ncbi:MAG: type secretion system YscQ/HrcQ family protein [Hyphomicrobiales bacterium]|nr:type secretion system YscQ/HrcQ family protein [Hyphomicrobiales bacterium]